MNFAHCATELSLHTEEDSEDRALFWDLDCGSCLAVAVAVAGSCSSDWTPSLGTSISRGCALKKKKVMSDADPETHRGEMAT